MAAGQIARMFTGPHATARIAAYLECTRHFCSESVAKMQTICLADGAPLPKDAAAQHEVQRAPWVLARAPGKVLEIRGGHPDGHQLEPPHFYGVPWPHRRGLKSYKKVVVKLTTFFSKKAVCEIQIDRRLESLHLKA